MLESISPCSTGLSICFNLGLNWIIWDFGYSKDITLFSTLSYLIKNHKHIGGTGNPSPIDLSAEVKNQITSDLILRFRN